MKHTDIAAGAKLDDPHALSDSDAERERIHASFLELSQLAARSADRLAPGIEKAAGLAATSLRNGGKIIACGNGGSAADAQHFTAELVGHMSRHRDPLAAISLSVDPSAVTAIGNDYGYEHLFDRQLRALGRPGDVLVAISTSGTSPNVLLAIEAAQASHLHTVVLTGAGGDPLLETCDVCMHVPSDSTQRVQEIHTAILHSLCEGIERLLLPKN